MNFVSLRIITDDVARLVDFYERATRLKAIWASPEFAEIGTSTCALAIGSRRTMALFGAGAAHPADNRTAIVEFLVEDVDADFERLEAIVGDVVMAPTTQPWGNRSLLFRDPDGNLINFFTPVGDAAIAKYAAAGQGAR